MLGETSLSLFVCTGAPPEEFLNQPITSSDHPFLRANANSVAAYKKSIGGTLMTFRFINLLWYHLWIVMKIEKWE